MELPAGGRRVALLPAAARRPRVRPAIADELAAAGHRHAAGRLEPVGSADPAVSGTVDGSARDGARELRIRIDGVPDTAGGDYPEARLLDPTGTRLVSLGALTRTADGRGYQGDCILPADMPGSDFSTVDI